MRPKNELWLIDDVTLDDADDVLSMPEIKQSIGHELRDDELGLRVLLERPDALRSFARRSHAPLGEAA